ncbi:MAG: beta-propeller domain-containing protein [Deltaproteobacteria bacterium]|nr:beta-propeller domain-containing protein [Deltaproteobacteria bacterium]
MKRFYLLIALSLLGVGCQSTAEDPVGSFQKKIGLTPMQSCDEVNSYLKTSAVQQMNDPLDAYLKEPDQFCVKYYYDVTPSLASSPASEAATFTPTNVQEKGVDESDLIKTDGKYVYALSQNKFYIFQVWPVSQFTLLASLAVDGEAEALYLSQNKVVILSKVWNNQLPVGVKTSPVNSGAGFTQMTVLDISAPKSPKVLRESYYPGHLSADRRIGDKIHLISNVGLSIPNMSYSIPYDLVDCAEEKATVLGKEKLVKYIEKLKKENLEQIDQFDFSKTYQARAYHSLSANGAITEDPAQCTEFYASSNNTAKFLVDVTTVSFADVTVADQHALVLGLSDLIYASGRALYVSEGVLGEDQTAIHRFALAEKPIYTGSGQVDGHLLNEYAMGEWQGALRVATTQGDIGGFGSNNSAVNQVYTLDTQDSGLKLLGKVEGLAKGEKIYAVRFIGPKGYVVTFKKVDPLFVIDLADPKNPKVAGELKVPGFSTYLHPIDENHLIGLGNDAEDMGDFAWFQGLKLSVFDVTNPSDPLEDSSSVIGGRGTDSIALYEPHAFTYDPTLSMLALPIDLHGPSAGGSQYGPFLYSGVQLYKLNADNSFTLAGTYQLSTNANEYGYGPDLEHVQRSIFLGDSKTKVLILLTTEGLSLHQLDGQLSMLKSYVW